MDSVWIYFWPRKISLLFLSVPYIYMYIFIYIFLFFPLNYQGILILHFVGMSEVLGLNE